MKTPNIKFRVLIIGRANAGKTSILQRVCDTTESPEIYRQVGWGSRERVLLDPTTERGEHDIADELTFTNHDGYIFHDSRGIEAGSEEELKVVQKFVREKSTEKRLRKRLHAIWYCIPMDNQRPSLDLKYFYDVCPDRNVPLIAIFTKYDQFKDNIAIRLKRDRCPDWETVAPAKADQVFQEQYLGKLGGTPHFVRLESMHEAGKRCTELLERTANALNDNVVSVMLLAVQRGNLELSVNIAVERASVLFRGGEKGREKIILKCLAAFPYMWWFDDDLDDLDDDDAFPLLPRILCSPESSAPQDADADADDDDADDDDDDLFDLDFDDAKKTLDFIISFVTKDKFSFHHHDIHHIIIAVILILESATLLYLSGTNRFSALDQAQSQYMQSVYLRAAERFSAVFQDYSDAEFIQFIINNRLPSNHVPLT